MQLGWSTLSLILIAVAIAWFWQSSLAARECANAAALDACDRLSLQFLDGTVAFARIAFVRNSFGRLALQRTYIFDYTADSIERRQGFVVLTGLHVDSIGYAPEEQARPAQARPTPPAPRPPQPPIDVGPEPGSSNVLKLDDWRDRRRQPPERQAADRRP